MFPSCQFLNEDLIHVRKKHELSQEDLECRQQIVNQLETYLKGTFNQDAELQVIGSTANGFGQKYSDLDLCLTLPSQNIFESQAVLRLEQKLKDNPWVDCVVAIHNAKVPIVKLRHKSSCVNIDICVFNILAVHNAALLRAYSSIDSRVKDLGYVVKAMAKNLAICNARKHTLSSYAWLNMTIYFLQQRQPPVLPVLQELYMGKRKPKRIVEEKWNSWFYDNLDSLPKIWPEYKTNKESLGELYEGFLTFYTEEFLFDVDYVSIRCREIRTRYERRRGSKWFEGFCAGNKKPMVIQDPFELTHNIAKSVNAQSMRSITESLRNELACFKTFWHCPLHASIIQKSKKPLSSVSATSIGSQATNKKQETKSDGKPVQTARLEFLRSRPIPLPSEVVRLLKMTQLEFIRSRPVPLPSEALRSSRAHSANIS